MKKKTAARKMQAGLKEGKAAKRMQVGMNKYASSVPQLKPIGWVSCVRVGGKKITSFSQIKTKGAGKISTGERLRRGIGIAIL
jgi:hypothetical protein